MIKSKKAKVFALTGDLGSGKTTFLQGMAKGMGIEKRIVSPTFILMRRYDAGKKVFYHIDLYRLDDNADEELENLGFKDFIKDSKNVIAIEWAEKAIELLPKNTTKIEFEYLGEDKRKIIIAK